MARARNIKPKFFQNEDLAELDPLARLAFIAMWTIADFKGCIEFRPKRLKVQLLPYDDCSIEEIAINLDKSGFIRIYSVDGQRYIKVMKFAEHQNPHKNERDGGSEIPDYEENLREINGLGNIENNRDKDGTAPAVSLFQIPSSPSLNPDSSPLAAASAAPKKSRKGIKTSLPNDFEISDGVRAWADKNGIQQLERHFASFIMKVRANGYTYVNWDSAFQNAITDDWAKVGNLPRGSPAGYESARDRSRREAAEQLTGRGKNDDSHTIIDIN